MDCFVYLYSFGAPILKVIIPRAQCGMTGFESPAAEYKQIGLSLDGA